MTHPGDTDEPARGPSRAGSQKLALAALVCVGYFAAAWCGGRLSALNDFTTFWPPSGVFVAALLLTRRREWPSVVAACLAANAAYSLLEGHTSWLALAYGAGNLVEALIGATLVGLFFEHPFRLRRVRHLGGLALASVVSASVGSIIGVSATVLARGDGAFWPLWSVRWMADVLGILLVAPLILTWADRDPSNPFRRRPVELLSFALLVLLVAIADTRIHGMEEPLAVPFLVVVVPMLAWAGSRLGSRVTTATMLTFAIFAVWNHEAGYGVFAADPGGVASGLVKLQVLLSGIAVSFTAISLGILEWSDAEQRLRSSEERLQLALRAARMITWEWSIETGVLRWSHDPTWSAGASALAADGSFNDALERIHPDDRDQLRRDLWAAQDTATLLHSEFRIVGADGSITWCEVVGQLAEPDDGTTRMIGVWSDATWRRQAEERAATALAKLKLSHANLLATLDALPVGTAVVEPDGTVAFLSRPSRRLIGADASPVGRPWEDVLPVDIETRATLREMVVRDAQSRTKFQAIFEPPSGERYWVDVEVLDDPHDRDRRIFTFCDVSELHDLRSLVNDEASSRDLIGRSEPMLETYRQIRDVAAVDATVLIEGETGTGKELVARAIHDSSDRAGRPFIAVNCASLTESLLASQLFGHRRGAFTGAVADCKGVFEAAEGGTILLDEIGDVSPGLQAMLLRVLQEREITRLGESKPRKVDVRILAATHRDLAHEVSRGSLRADLLYRLRVARVHVPPLRARRKDIPLLVASFLRRSATGTGKAVSHVSVRTMQLLIEHAWPGNVRELRSAIEAAVIRCQRPVIEPEDLPSEIVSATSADTPTPARISEPDLTLSAALRRTRGNRTAAARLLGISRATLYRRLGESQDASRVPGPRSSEP
jgi:PAS domain S-box-containing protein